ncbi:MAG: hypothetical protein ACXWB7_07325 [Kaistella sp.]
MDFQGIVVGFNTKRAEGLILKMQNPKADKAYKTVGPTETVVILPDRIFFRVAKET